MGALRGDVLGALWTADSNGVSALCGFPSEKDEQPVWGHPARRDFGRLVVRKVGHRDAMDRIYADSVNVQNSIYDINCEESDEEIDWVSSHQLKHRPVVMFSTFCHVSVSYLTYCMLVQQVIRFIHSFSFHHAWSCGCCSFLYVQSRVE